MPGILIRRVQHFYEWSGGRFNPELPTMVFIHGWGGSSRYWEDTAATLADSYNCLLYDLRGFGRSHLPRPTPVLDYDLEDYALDLAELLNQLDLQQVDIHAHSFGASVALLFADLYPERVHRLMLVCSGIFTYNPIAFKAFHFFGSYVVWFRPPWLIKLPGAGQIFMARFLHRPLDKTTNQRFLADFLEADYPAALETIYTAVSKKMSERMPECFTRLAMPTLLVAGEKDQIIPASLARRAVALNRAIAYQEIPAVGHFPMLEAPQEYLNIIQTFLKAS